MDYEKAYKEARERAKAFLGKGFIGEDLLVECIFPELKESEDEKIRKRLVEYFHEVYDKYTCLKSTNLLWEGLEVKKVIAYLERQKEQKPMQFKGESLVEIIKGEFEGFRSLLKKKGIDYEPQSTYWESLARLFDSSAREYLKERRPAEWSEEDEKIRQSIIKDIEFERNYISATTGKVIGKYNEQITWLHFLPKRFELQPKVEWSEEDERILMGIIERGSSQIPPYEPALHEEQMEWLMKRLKSLRLSWKPSEKQINALERAIIKMHTPNDIGTLAELRDNLKKL